MAANVNAFEVFAKVGVDSSGLKSGLDRAKGMVSGFGGVLSGLGGLAGRIFSGISSAAKNFMNDAYRVSQEFEQSMAQVAATLGKSVEEVNADIQTTMINGEEWTGNLREFALEMSAQTKFTATEVGEALNYMALAGYDTAKSMEMLPSVLSLAAAGAMELGRASDVVTDAQTAFGITSERTTLMIDEMAKAASTGNTSVAQLGEAFLTVGGLAKEVGGGMYAMADGTEVATDNLQEIETAFVAMANAGVKGSEAGMHMRNILLKLSSPTEDAKEKMQALGISAFDASGNMKSLNEIFTDLAQATSQMAGNERLEFLSDIFNARDITAAQSLLSAVTNGSWDSITSSILNAEGAAERMAQTQLNTVMGQRQLMESAMDAFKIELTSSVNLPFAGWMKQGTNLISDMTDALKKGGLDKMLETLFDEGGKILENLLKTGMPKIIGKIPRIITSVLPNLLSALVTIGKSVVDAFTSEKFIKNIRAAVKNSIFLIKTYFKENQSDLNETGSNLFNLIADGLKNAATFIGENLIPVLTGILNFFANPDTISSIIQVGSDIIGNLIGGMLSEDSLDALFDPENGMAKFISTMITAIGDVTSNLLEGATDIIVALVGYFTDPKNKREILGGAEDILIALGEAFLKVTYVLRDSIAKLMVEIADQMVGGFDADATAIEIISKLAEAVASKAIDIPRWMFMGLGGNIAESMYRDNAMNEEYLNSGFPGTIEQWYGEEGAAWRAQQATQQAASNSYERTNSTISAAGAAGQSAYQAEMRRRAYRNYLNNASLRGYATGGVFDRESIIRVGENGAEAVMPLENNTEWIDKLAARLGNGVTIQFGNIYVTGVKDAGREVVAQIDTALRQYQIMQSRGIGGTGWA